MPPEWREAQDPMQEPPQGGEATDGIPSATDREDKVSKKKYVYAITLRGKEKTVLGTLEGFDTVGRTVLRLLGAEE
jgi:hypothetical protein